MKRSLITTAVLVLAAAVTAGTENARADAMSDQKKAYELMHMKLPSPPALCRLMSKSEVERALGMPVGNGTSAGPVSGCAWRAIGDRNKGLLIVRGLRDDWYPDTRAPQYRPVGGIGSAAYTAYEQGLGYEAAALTPAGVTNVQLAGTGTAADALRILKIVMNRR